MRVAAWSRFGIWKFEIVELQRRPVYIWILMLLTDLTAYLDAELRIAESVEHEEDDAA